MVTRTKKRKKSKGQRGKTTYGHGARKKWKGSGHRGGFGMAGSGKRADQKKSLVIKLYGNKYFGKKGITSKKTQKSRRKIINLEQIQKNIDKFLKDSKNNEINLKEYKILGDGELKDKLTIVAKGFTDSAKKKIEKAGGKAVLAKSIENPEPKKTVKKNSQ